MTTKFASKILASWANHAIHQFVWNCSSEYLLCNWTMPVQDRIHLAQEHFVSGEKQQSGSPQKAAVRNFKLLTSGKKLKD